MARVSRSKIKSNLRSLKLSLPLNIVKKESEKEILNTMATAVMSVLGMNLQQNVSIDAFEEEPINLLIKNSLEMCSIDKELRADELNINITSDFSDMQTLAIPFDDDFVEQLIECPKVEIKSETINSFDKEGKSLIEEERTLLIGKVGETYIPFQFNIKKGQPTKKDLFFSTNLSVILNGKEYTVLERYDSKKGHTNLMLDKKLRESAEKQDLQIFSTPHLHVYNQKVMLTLFNSLSQKGFIPEDILQANIMSRQDAIAYQNFKSHESARNYFHMKYNIIPSAKRKSETIENIFKTSESRLERIQDLRTQKFIHEVEAENSKKKPNQNNKNYKKKKKIKPEKQQKLPKAERQAIVQQKQEERKQKKEKTKKQNQYQGKSKTGIDSQLDF